MGHRETVLSMYRQVLRLSRNWAVHSEREYIANEVKTLVRRNKDLTSKDVIAEKLQEFESRIQTGIHYKIPYPRPVNVAPGAIGKNPQVVTPVYLHSYGHASARSGASQKRANTSPVYED